jgi:predicted metal-dependent hydrolase
MAECFYSHKETLAKADPYVRALFAWHAIEEMEHRDVAFDVMQNVAKVTYAQRAKALVLTSALMTGFTMYRTNIMLKADGFNRLERARLFAEGLTWLFGKNGILSPMKQAYRDWFKKDFHPSQHAVVAQYPVWLKTLAETGDPIQAGQAFWEAGK